MMKKEKTEITIESLIKKISTYTKVDLDLIEKAYYYAKEHHANQKRESGEDYIVHPLAVAYILAGMHADSATLCAALLHDVIEDTSATYEDIKNNFNNEIAYLVDGVTKFSHLNFNNRDEFLATNIRRIVVSIRDDARIVIIKLVDRIHNMRTLEYKTQEKRQEIALQTLEIFVPIAYYIGAYKIKSELENVSFRYLKPDVYHDIERKMANIEHETRKMLNKMVQETKKELQREGIKCTLEIRYKDVYSVYKKTLSHPTMENIHDLLGIKVIVNTIKECYLALMIIHRLYTPMSFKFKDYIVKPKTNMYRSIHTTVFANDDHLVQFQIRTREMERIATYGLTSYWFKNRHLAKVAMQNDLENNFQFFRSIKELDSGIVDNIEFVKLVKRELFSQNVYVRTTNGEIVELPIDATPIDFAYKIHSDLGNTMIAAVVNDEIVGLDYKLQNNDRVRIITDKNAFIDRSKWLSIATTTHAKKRINDYLKEMNKE